MKEIFQKIIDEIENNKQLTKAGTNERAMVYNSGLDKAIKIIKEKIEEYEKICSDLKNMI